MFARLRQNLNISIAYGLSKGGDNDALDANVEGFRNWHHIKGMTEEALANLTAAVTTINTPLPTGIDERTLLACLRGEIAEERWRVHVQALFDEVDVSVLHNLVIDHLVTFQELSNAIDAWHVLSSDNERWIRQMAGFSVGRPDAEGAGRSRQP